MQLETRKPFEKIMFIVDLLNPYIVLLSIIGLILEYTGLGNFNILLLINKGIDVYFVFDFLIRMIAYKSVGDYFIRNYGWVDLLAAVPGLLIFFEGNRSLLGLFKALRIGKFFKMIRVLRFLRMFSFLKKMKSDSRYIQSRLMKIGVSTVLVVIAGLFFIDAMNYQNLVTAEAEKVHTYIAIEGKDKFLENVSKFDIKAYQTKIDGNKIFKLIDKDGTEKNITSSEFLDITFSNDYTEITLEEFPDMGFALNTALARDFHNSVMLTLVITLVFLLLIQLFYIGTVLAKDIRVAQLIIDSLEADDFFLMSEEQRQVEEKYGSLEIKEGEDEILSLRKAVGKLTAKIEDLKKRENEINNMEYMVDIKEETAKKERMEIEEAIEKTAESIYERLKDTSLSSTNETNFSRGVESIGTNIDSEILIKDTAEEIVNSIKSYLESEGVLNISKKVVTETINKILPRIKAFLENKA